MNPDSLKAPVIISVSSDGNVQSLHTFIDALQQDKGASTSYEIRRLGSFFEDCGAHLDRLLARNPDDFMPQKKAELKALHQPAALMYIFNKMAAKTGALLLSEVAIIPRRILFKQNEFLPGVTSYKHPYSYKEKCYGFDFGFIQAPFRNQKGKEESITFPLIAIEDDVLEGLKPFAPQKLLRTLQAAATWMNHDMLHHFSLYGLNPDIGKTQLKVDQILDSPLYRWVDCRVDDIFPRKHIGGRYEAWNILCHADIKSDDDNAAIEAVIDEYFVELERIKKEKNAAAVPHPDAHKGEIGEQIDYLGSILGFTLARVLPFQSPVMERYFSHMERLTPEHAIVEDTLLGMAREHYNKHITGIDRLMAFLNSDECRPAISKPEKTLAEIAFSYQKCGHTIIPAVGTAPTLRQMREMQLIMLDAEAAYLHAMRSSPRSDIYYSSKAMDLVTLELIPAAAASLGMAPARSLDFS